MLLSHAVVIALVDGREFKLYRNVGSEKSPELSPMDAPRLDERNMNAGARHLSSSANPTGSQLEEDSHAAAVTDWLNSQVSERKIHHLVIAAAPRTLGEMRRRYGKPLEAALVGEVHKELIGCNSKEIVEALRA